MLSIKVFLAVGKGRLILKIFMKTKLIASALLLMSVTAAFAVMIVPFPGWNWLKEHSEDIVVVHCSETPTNSDDDGVFYAKVDVTSILKAVTNSISSQKPELGPTILRSLYSTRQGEFYLIFSSYHEGSFQAFEEYRVIPLGIQFSADSIADKSLDEQIQILFQRRLKNLDREIKNNTDEAQRLESGLEKSTN